MNQSTNRLSRSDLPQPDDLVSRVVIRQVASEDLPALEWDGEYRHFRRLFANAYERARSGLSVLWVAEEPQTGIIGQVFIQLTCDRPELANGRERAYLYSFRIKPNFRSKGLGQQVLAAVETDLLRRGVRVLTLNVAKDNTRAIELYRRVGYQIVAHEPGVWSYQDHEGAWHRVVEPAWRMEKQLMDQGSKNSIS